MKLDSTDAPRRLRDVHPIGAGGVVDLLYDLERTFVLEVPVPLRGRLAAALDCGADDPGVRQWLLDEDVLTTEQKRGRAEGSSPRLPEVSDVSLDMSGACNMGCTYCFENDIKSRIGPMSEETAEATLDFVFAATGKADRVALHFGSGEPLIRIDLLRWIVQEAERRAKAIGKPVVFELTTNATLVTDDIAAFLACHPFNVRVSCDGPPEFHDRHRPMFGGRPSYELVVRGLKRLMAHLPDRVTVNTVLWNGGRLRDLWSWTKVLGLRRYHVIKVGAFEGDLNLRTKELAEYRADLQSICEDILADLCANRVPIEFQPITKIVRRLMIPEPITRFCGVAGSYLGVSSSGEVYPCFRHLGLKKYKLGDVGSGVSDAKRREFLGAQAADVDSRPICESCWARYLCGGGCYADSTVYGKDALRPQTEHCPFWRAEIEVAISFYDTLRRRDPAWCLRLFGDDPEKLFSDAEETRPSFSEPRNCQ